MPRDTQNTRNTQNARIPTPKYMSFVYTMANKILDPKTKVVAVDSKNGVIVKT
jgi:hypothetical protein